jgi:alkaline phosphatase D
MDFFSRRVLLSSALMAFRPIVAQRFAANPFVWGVASGDPDASSVMLWSRLQGAEPGRDVEVDWELAADDGFREVVKKGKARAMSAMGHSLRVEAEGLESDRWYWYRFRCGGFESTKGRTRTMPAAQSMPKSLRLAVTSCQHFEQGLYTAWGHVANEPLDLITFLGDYIYEDGGRDERVRKHEGAEVRTLTDYRLRYAQYRTDPHLQKAHAHAPWLITWDDHEVDNNYADLAQEAGESEASFRQRRAAAYQAWFEFMPVRVPWRRQSEDLRIYRAVSFGRLARFFVLDTRQYRTDQPCGDGRKEPCADARAESATLLGREQWKWLRDGLDSSAARWNVLAQQVMMGAVDFTGGARESYSMDQWPGYVAERRRLLQYLKDRKPANPVVLTGDIHSNWLNELRVEERRMEEAPVAVEFVGTSISSGGDGYDAPPAINPVLLENPQVRFFNAQRGFVRCTITPEQWQSEYCVLPFVSRPNAPLQLRSSFVVEAGKSLAHSLKDG